MLLQPVVGYHSTSIKCARLVIVSRDGTSVMNMLCGRFSLEHTEKNMYFQGFFSCFGGIFSRNRSRNF